MGKFWLNLCYSSSLSLFWLPNKNFTIAICSSELFLLKKKKRSFMRRNQTALFCGHQTGSFLREVLTWYDHPFSDLVLTFAGLEFWLLVCPELTLFCCIGEGLDQTLSCWQNSFSPTTVLWNWTVWSGPFGIFQVTDLHVLRNPVTNKKHYRPSI